MSDKAFKTAVCVMLGFIAVTLFFVKLDTLQILRLLEHAR